MQDSSETSAIKLWPLHPDISVSAAFLLMSILSIRFPNLNTTIFLVSCPCQQPLPLRHCSSYGSCDGIKQLTSVTVTCFCVVLNSLIQYLTHLDNAFGQMFPIPLNHSFLPFKHIVTSGSEPSMARELHTTDTSGQRASPRVILSSRYSSNTPSRQNWFKFFLWFTGRLAFKNWCYGWVPDKKLISSVIKV